MSERFDLKVLVIVPAFNEVANLPNVVADVRSHCPEWDIAVVDDGSKDTTTETARALGTIVLQLPFNLGIGGAVQTGLIYAARNGYDVAIQVDGDGQHRGEETYGLVQTVASENIDVAVGSRFLDKNGFRSTFTRRIGIQVLRRVISILTGWRVTDPTSGHRAFGRKAIELLSTEYPQEYPEPEVLYILHRHGLKVKEIGVGMNPRRHGRSSIRVFDSFLYMVKVLLSIAIHATRRPRRESEMNP